MTARGCASSAASSGARGDRWKAWPPIRITWISRLPPGRRKRLKVETTRNAFAYVFAGSGTFRDSSEPRAVLTEQVAKPDAPPVYDASNHSLVLFDRGDEIVVQAGDEGIRFLLVSGKPIEEPVAWYGPIVMNTQEQLRQALANCRTALSSSTAEGCEWCSFALPEGETAPSLPPDFPSGVTRAALLRKPLGLVQRVIGNPEFAPNDKQVGEAS